MISTSDLHLLGCHFEQYPDYQPRDFKTNTSKDHPQEPENENLGVFHFPVLSFGFVFVLLGITCTLASICIFRVLTHTHNMYTLHQDMDMDIASWSARFMLPQNKSVKDSLMGVAFVEALARKPHDLSSRWRDALDLMPLDMKMELDFNLEVEAMPVESAVLRLEDWVYNVAGL
ncbi:uncharacterized protein B0T23DRAFT_372077 [Neurospora hispaniola]|uniref:Uncharacterized protein n=1 Tax=Neurospora hispaniola TaxID=588809 RepID=A0AAJ0IHF5_9PEZI|nr:hypothetical protein B0T23DRAFT_372077 [Neurospora hispaniola]